MGKNITIDGNTVYMNGEAVAQALGDFSPAALASALRYDPRVWPRKPKQPAFVLVETNAAAFKAEFLGAFTIGPKAPAPDAPPAEQRGALHDEIDMFDAQPKVITQFLDFESSQCWPPAPRELIEKARQYLPDQMGLLRLYADKRGFSCAQVDAAVAYVKGL